MGSLTVLAYAGALTAAVQSAGWAHAVLIKSERNFDLLGATNHVANVLLALYLGGNASDPRRLTASILVAIWGIRLSSYLAYRIRSTKDHTDWRFKNVRDKPAAFLLFWGLQGVWVLITALPVVLLNGTPITAETAALGLLDYGGWAVSAAGLVIEIVADYQKSSFRSDSKNDGKFVSHGLWRLSRHPNYLGEIMFWAGVGAASILGLEGMAAKATAIASPAFVFVLLCFVSGIPILERGAKKRYGNDPRYIEYRRTTSLLIPGIW